MVVGVRGSIVRIWTVLGSGASLPQLPPPSVLLNTKAPPVPPVPAYTVVGVMGSMARVRITTLLGPLVVQALMPASARLTPVSDSKTATRTSRFTNAPTRGTPHGAERSIGPTTC